ncbi:unnamed protein product, partial [Prorocentrum cordatum]
DMSLHPILWEQEEVMWLKASPDGYFQMTLKRFEADGIVGRLLERCPGAAVPAKLASDQEGAGGGAAVGRGPGAGEQGLQVEVDGRTALALCPLVGELKNAPRLEASDTNLLPNVAVGTPVEDRGRLGARVADLGAAATAGAGPELQRRLMGNTAVVFARYGVVPGTNEPGALSDMDLMDMNPECTALVMPNAGTLAQVGVKGAGLAEKHAIAKEFAGINLDWPIPDDEPVMSIFLRFPNETLGRGRLLPLCRWLAIDLPKDPQEISSRRSRMFSRRASSSLTRRPPRT